MENKHEYNKDEDTTLITRILQKFDECLKSSKKKLNDAGRKADRLRRRVNSHPDEIRRVLTPIPQKTERD